MGTPTQRKTFKKTNKLVIKIITTSKENVVEL